MNGMTDIIPLDWEILQECKEDGMTEQEAWDYITWLKDTNNKEFQDYRKKMKE